MAKNTQLLITFLLGIIVGSGPFLMKQCLTPDIIATGILKSHTPDSGITADFPGGYYVESRVYVEDIDTSLLGETVTVEGDIVLIPDSGHHWHYPLIINKNHLTKVR